jgi:hypothetical protein
VATKQERMAELQKAMEELQNEPDEDDEYEIEIYSPKGHGARLPYRKGKGFLAEHFGIDADSLPKPGDDKSTGKPTRTRKTSNDQGNADSDTGDSRQSNLKLFRQRENQQPAASGE